MSEPEHGAGAKPGSPLAGPAAPPTNPSAALNPAPERVVRRDKHRHEICEHQRRRSTCKECGGASICEHQRRRSHCPFCRPIGHIIHVRSGAKYRGYVWQLTDEQAIHLLSKPCAYCGVAPSGGIDRRKNEYGYTVGNSLPCCAGCNKAKLQDTAKTYIERCHKVSRYCVDRETFMARTAKLQQELKEFEQWQSESTSAEPATNEEK